MNFNVRPAVPPERLAQVTNTLADWLLAVSGVEAVSGWDKDEWAAAAWVAYWQNALPWLVHRVRETGASVPGTVYSRLVSVDANSRERTRLMLDACVEILGAFALEGIDAMPLKGAVLAAVYYPDPLIRPLADLDILIRRRDLNHAIRIIKRLGYRFYSRSAEDEVYLRGERQPDIWAPDNVHPVEIHYTLREEYAGVGYNMAEHIWRHSVKQPFWHDMEVRLPALPALLQHVCAHMTSDWFIQRGRLIHLEDIRQLAANMDEVAWGVLRAGIPDDAARFVYPALAFARSYSGVRIPAELLAQLEALCPQKLIDWIAVTELADASESNPGVRSGLGFELAQRLALSKVDQAHFWLRSLFPRRWNLSKRYPRLVQTPFWPVGYILINFDRGWHLIRKRTLRRRDQETEEWTAHETTH